MSKSIPKKIFGIRRCQRCWSTPLKHGKNGSARDKRVLAHHFREENRLHMHSFAALPNL
jgi:hypothetical protein